MFNFSAERPRSIWKAVVDVDVVIRGHSNCECVYFYTLFELAYNQRVEDRMSVANLSSPWSDECAFVISQ